MFKYGRIINAYEKRKARFFFNFGNFLRFLVRIFSEKCLKTVKSHYHPCQHENCGQYFRSQIKLDNHIATEHGGSQVPYLFDRHFITYTVA